MSNDRLPEWLKSGRSRVHDRHPLQIRDDWPRLPRPGDVRVADPTTTGRCDPRMVLVVDLDADIGVAEVALVSNETDFATAADMVIPARISGLPFDLLVESGVVANLWCIQLGRLVAELGLGLAHDVNLKVEAARTMAAGFGRAEAESALLDQRLLFRERELEELGALCEDCREANVPCGRRVATVVDPVLVHPSSRHPQKREFERWLSVAEIVAHSGETTIPTVAVECGLEARRHASRPWGPDEVRALIPLIERVLADQPPEHDDVVEIDPARTRPDRAIDGELRSMLSAAAKRGERTVRLLTSPDAWAGEFREPKALASVVTSNGARLQVVRHNLEAEP